MKPNDPQYSDEATGLPPLADLDQNNAILLRAWHVTEGVASVHGNQTQAMRTLHVRGLVRGDGPADIEWGQVFVSVPVELVMEVAADLVKGSTQDLETGDGGE